MEIILKTKVILILVAILSFAMFLQSLILLFLELRASIKADVNFAQQLLLKESSMFAFLNQNKGMLSAQTDNYYLFSNAYGDFFTCVFIEIGGEMVSASSPCKFQNELIKKSQESKAKKNFTVGFSDDGWQGHFFNGQVALFSVPLLDADGAIYGSINAERSLLSVYSRFQKEVTIALCYLLGNMVIFGTIGFLRLSRIFFRPLEKLVLTAENYRSDEQSLMTFDDDESPFRKLSISLNALLDRIRRDNQQLRKAVSDLEAANNELKEKNELVIRSEKLASTGRLSAGLAHEIGNPLTIVQGYVELLGREDLSREEKRKFSGNAQKELDRIKTLIRQLLDFSRPLQAVKDFVAVNALISEVIFFVSVEKSFADCRIRTDLRAGKDTLLVDKDALRQVLVNILLNAVDATAEKNGKSEICIVTYNELSGGDSWLGISVQDNGVGIAEEILKHVFDPFYTTKEVGQGTGLGLFVCHTIIDKMGGRIELFNRDPEGLEVKIILPITDERDGAPEIN